MFSEYDGISIEHFGRLSETEAPLAAGETRRGQTLSSIAPTIEIPRSPVQVEQIVVHYKNGDTETFGVGSWVFEPQLSSMRTAHVDEWPAVMPKCGPFTSTLLGPSASDLAHTSLQADQPGVKLGSGTSIGELSPEGTVTVSLDLVCDPEFDFFVVTPQLVRERPPQDTSEMSFDPIMIGHTDISDADVARITER